MIFRPRNPEASPDPASFPIPEDPGSVFGPWDPESEALVVCARLGDGYSDILRMTSPKNLAERIRSRACVVGIGKPTPPAQPIIPGIFRLFAHEMRLAVSARKP